jgi:Predicted transcriptional regulators
MSTQTPKQILFGQFAALAKCLSHPHRLELLEQLAQGERSVEILAGKLGLSTANASQHLQQMLRAGMVTSVRKGKFVVYGLADHAVLELLSSLRLIAERNSVEVEKLVRNYFDKLDALEPVTRKELVRRLRSGGVMVTRCPARRRVQAGAFTWSGEHPAAGAQGPAFAIQALAGDHRLLSRAILRALV